MVSDKLPTVEINKENMLPGTDSFKSTADLVREALETYGCVVIEYGKANHELQKTLFGFWDDLFNLPLETKKKHTFKELDGEAYDGNYPDMSLYEAFGIEEGITLEAAKEFSNLMWPNGNEKFSESVCSYSKLMMELDQTVIKMITSSYGLEKHYEPLTQSIFYMTKLIKYKAQAADETMLGLVPHRDKGFTAIINTNEVQGLEIEIPSGEWIHFKPSPDKFVVVAGEALVAWSNGRIYSPLHKVIPKGNKEKHSIVLFSFIRGTTHVPEELVDDKNPLKYKPFSHYEFLIHCKKHAKQTAARCIENYCGV